MCSCHMNTASYPAYSCMVIVSFGCFNFSVKQTEIMLHTIGLDLCFVFLSALEN